MRENKTITVGDALEVGLLSELFTNSDNSNIKAAVSYLYLNDFISPRGVLKIQVLVSLSNVLKFDDQDKRCKQLCDIVFELMNDWKFASKVRLNSLDALFAYTAKMEIPEWMIQKVDEIYEYIPDVKYLNDCIFYLTKESGNTIMVGEHVDGLAHSKNLLYAAVDDIEGVNKDSGIIYLTSNNIHDHHFEYHINEQYLKVIDKELIGVADGTPIYRIKGQIGFITNNKFHKILNISPGEFYEVRDGYILVSPEETAVDIFKPFIVFLDGRKRLCSDSYVRNRIWMRIISYLNIHTPSSISITSMVLDKDVDIDKDIDTPDFTVNGIKGKLKDLLGDRLYIDKSAIQFDQVLDILSRHCDPDGFDVTDLLYTLISAERHYHTDYSDVYGFTNMVYFRLLDLEETDNLDELLDNLEILKDKMIIIDEKEDKDEYNEKSNSSDTTWVGSFEFNNEEMEFSKSHLSGATIFEDLAMYPPQKVKYKGLVNYNTKINKYFIHYPRNLDIDEIASVINEFSIDVDDYYLVVQSI